MTIGWQSDGNRMTINSIWFTVMTMIQQRDQRDQLDHMNQYESFGELVWTCQDYFDNVSMTFSDSWTTLGLYNWKIFLNATDSSLFPTSGQIHTLQIPSDPFRSLEQLKSIFQLFQLFQLLHVAGDAAHHHLISHRGRRVLADCTSFQGISSSEAETASLGHPWRFHPL